MLQPKNVQNDNNLIRLLSLLSKYRILNLRQVRLMFPDKQPDLELLQAAGLIHFWQAPTSQGALQHLTALSRGGARILAVRTGQELADVPYLRSTDLKRSLFTLEHALALTEVGLALEKLGGIEASFSVLRFETSPTRIGASVRFIKEGKVWRVPLVADALVQVAYQGKEHWFLLEIDRGTTTLKRLRQKFVGYSVWSREQGPFQRFGVKNLRLLTATVNNERLKRLKTLAAQTAPGSGFFWFALLTDLTLEAPCQFLSAIWHKSTTEHALCLFDRCSGPPAPSQAGGQA